ncbi:PIN domain-containing protein [candidate division KSB1 bacterium]|nr:PIN domain-containing protein [candidate division KSB1 bacterium]
MVKGLDTSVLLYALDTAAPLHGRAVDVLEQAIGGKWLACVCETSLLELAEILTDPRRVRKPLAPAQVAKALERLTRYPQPQVLEADALTYKRALRLMEKYPVQRGRFIESQIAATLLEHGVRTIVTANSNGFAAIRELTVENPFEALFA